MIADRGGEAAFLGCLLTMQRAMLVRGFLRQVEAEDFLEPAHRTVLAATQALVENGMPCDPVTVLGQLRRTGVAAYGGPDRSDGVFLADLVASPPSMGTVGVYLLGLLEARYRRHLHEVGERLQQLAEQSDLAVTVEVVTADLIELGRLAERVATRGRAERETAA